MFKLDESQSVNVSAVVGVRIVERSSDKKAILHVYLGGGHSFDTECDSVAAAQELVRKIELIQASQRLNNAR